VRLRDRCLGGKPRATSCCRPVDWDRFELDSLAKEIRRAGPPSDAERTIWAFEHVLVAARLDPELLGHVCAAAISMIATQTEMAPREVLEQLFRRSITDERWRGTYLPLLRAGQA
jgi:hypothetical protein